MDQQHQHQQQQNVVFGSQRVNMNSSTPYSDATQTPLWTILLLSLYKAMFPSQSIMIKINCTKSRHHNYRSDKMPCANKTEKKRKDIGKVMKRRLRYDVDMMTDTAAAIKILV
uniref:Uncharacterized protein n=1 Tax=Glossina pallidipes TaxID=7398 RepID=A0A1A9ZZH0_GLOPL